MKNFFTKAIICFAVLVFCGITLVIPALAYDFDRDSGLEDLAKDTGHKEIETDFSTVTFRLIMPLLGVAYLILMMYAGYLWMAASGNQEQVSKAKKIIIAATIGLLLALASYAISYYVVSILGEGLVK